MQTFGKISQCQIYMTFIMIITVFINHPVTSLQIGINHFNMLGYQHHIQKLVLFHPPDIIMWACFVAPFITDTYRTSVHLFRTDFSSMYYTFPVPILCASSLFSLLIMYLYLQDLGIQMWESLFIVSIRTPLQRFDSGTVWAGSGEPAPRPLTVLRGLCCPLCAHWRR